MKNMFSLVSANKSLSSRSLLSSRKGKANYSCMVSAAHPLVQRCSYRLFRFSSFSYRTKGVIFIGRPPLRSDRRYLGKFGVSSGKIAVFCNVVAQS